MELEIDLHSVRIVRAIAEHGSISAAAQALGYSQPAVSQHLRRTEARLGVALVQRAGRGIRLTEPGQVLARHSVAITSALDAAAGELAELVGLQRGTARLAGFPTASSTLVPQLLGTLRRSHPGIGIRYIECEPPEALELLRDGVVDAALTFAFPGDGIEAPRERALRIEPLFSEDVVVVIPAGHPLAAAEEVALRDLAADPWIAGCPLCRGHLLSACAADGVTPRIELETDNVTAVLNLVASGVGVALLPRLALATASLPADAVVRPTRPSSSRVIQLVSRRDAERVPTTNAVLAAVRALDGGRWGLAGA